MVSLPPRVEALAFRAALGLPPVVVRRLAGRRVLHDGQVLDPETQWMLRLQRLTREPDAATLPVPQGRAAIIRQSRLTGGRQPIGERRDLTVPTPDGAVPARLYVPRGSTGDDPLLVFLHGGGMVYGDLDSHDPTCRLLAERAGTRVLALDYRLAPEHPFPAGVDDAWAGFQWAVEHADELGADPERVAVGGDSAGGMLGAVVALRAAEAGVRCVFQLLVYPATDFHETSESRRAFAQGYYLTQAFMDIAEDSYLSPADDRRDPSISVLHVEKVPEDLAPALVVTAGFDPLRDEGEAYARLLAGAGVRVELHRYPGLVHGFFNVVGAGRSQRAAVAEVAARLRAALHADD